MFSKDDNIHKLKGSAKTGQDDAEATKRDFTEMAHQAGHTARHYLDAARDEVSHVTNSVTSEVRKNPVQSSILALGLGFVLGSIFRR